MRHLFLAILLTVYSAANELFAKKSFTIDSLEITATVMSDGNLQVIEKRTYRFKGGFSYAYRSFPKNQGVEFGGFEIFEDGEAYRLEEGEKPSTFVIEDKEKETLVGWSFTAKNESRTFEIRYQVANLVKRHEDIAELYFQFIGKEWKVSQSNVTVILQLFEDMASDEIYHWLHGPGHAFSTLLEDGSIKIVAPKVPRRSFLEIRALYPESWFDGVPSTGMAMLDSIKTEEAVLAEKANQKRLDAIQKEKEKEAQKQVANWLTPLIFFILLMWSVQIHFKYRKRYPKVSAPSKPQMNPPSDFHPAFYSLMRYNTQMYREIQSNLLYLAHLGAIKMEDRDESENPKKRSNKKVFWVLEKSRMRALESKLSTFDKKFIEFIFGTLAKGKDEISIYQFQKANSKWTKFQSEYYKLLRDEAKVFQFWDEESKKGTNLGIIPGLLSSLMIVPAVYYFGPTALFLLVLPFIAFILCATTTSRTKQWHDELPYWVSYSKSLKLAAKKGADLSLDKENISIHLVYAILFGLGKNNIENILGRMSANDFAAYLPWYVILISNNQTNPNPSAIASQMSQSLGTVMSSSGGFGGGASFGGGGGVSAGGGGAR
ncbi:MAG: DUF2207 domain-containing protein [Cyclobacteriaceae bacterium]|nr:DUF2207 domain-containing protein [Cyclobacteriaceae bacterium]MCH8517402.1 DUF2207 domain-containing protein [Cyclobacteriaceae bacterium]